MDMTIVNQRKELRQFISYVIIGTIAVATDNFIFILLLNVDCNMYIANFLSVNCGLALSFSLNSRFNFKRNDNRSKRALRFFMVGYMGLIISMQILKYGTNIFNIHEIYIKLISTIIVGILQYSVNKLITFNEI